MFIFQALSNKYFLEQLKCCLYRAKNILLWVFSFLQVFDKLCLISGFFPSYWLHANQRFVPMHAHWDIAPHTPHWAVQRNNNGKLLCSNVLLFWLCKSPLRRDLAWDLFRIAAKYTEGIYVHKANDFYCLTSKWSVLLLCNPIISLLYSDRVGSWLKYGPEAAGLV